MVPDGGNWIIKTNSVLVAPPASIWPTAHTSVITSSLTSGRSYINYILIIAWLPNGISKVMLLFDLSHQKPREVVLQPWYPVILETYKVKLTKMAAKFVAL